MADQQPKLVSKEFTDAAASLAQRYRIDARTVGYPDEDNAENIVWRGMSPVPGKADLWYVVTVEEKTNQYLKQVDKNERLVQIDTVMGKGKDETPLTFEKAVEQLAVWEYARLARGSKPVEGQERKDLGKHYYKNLLMQRGYLVDVTGTLAPITDILPTQPGKFLKSDLDALAEFQDGLRGENILNNLISAHDPIFISNTSLEDDLQSFGEIALFDKMQLFTDVLVKYAGVKLQQVQDFYADPTKKDGVDLTTALAQNPFFSKENIERFNKAREELFGPVFRFFHVAESDWDKDLDLKSRDFQKGLLVNPDAGKTYNNFNRTIGYPVTQEDVDAILFISARSLYYFREKMKDSPQKDALERNNIYKQGDIDDLLNYLNLLDIKYKYKELAEAAIALPGTQRAKEMDVKKQAFLQRVQNFKDKVKSTQEYSPAMEKQIDAFVRSSAPIYLLDRIADMPGKIAKASQYIKDRLLPPPAAAKPPAPPAPKQ